MLATGVTRRLTAHFVSRWRSAHPAGCVIRRDLGAAPPPHPDEATLAALARPDAARTPADVLAARLSDACIAELEAADLVLIGSPMYNFSVTSSLKAWFDLVSRPGRTFRYGPKGHEGLLANKTIVAVTGRGGFYQGPTAPAEAVDLQEDLFRHFFAFMGLTDVRFVHAEGQAINPVTATEHEAFARAAIERMIEDGLGAGAGPAFAAI